MVSPVGVIRGSEDLVREMCTQEFLQSFSSADQYRALQLHRSYTEKASNRAALYSGERRSVSSAKVRFAW